MLKLPPRLPGYLCRKRPAAAPIVRARLCETSLPTEPTTGVARAAGDREYPLAHPLAKARHREATGVCGTVRPRGSIEQPSRGSTLCLVRATDRRDLWHVARNLRIHCGAAPACPSRSRARRGSRDHFLVGRAWAFIQGYRVADCSPYLSPLGERPARSALTAGRQQLLP